MPRLLITGVSGLLGGHVFSHAESSFLCLGTYNTFAAPPTFINWRQIDLTSSKDVLFLVNEFKPDCILHTAANSNLDDCERNPDAAKQVNVRATAHLVHASKQVDARFIYVSTDMVFDGTGSLYREEEKTNPISVYGRTKAEAESIVRQIDNSVIVRSALIYGRRQYGGRSFSMWMEERLREGRSVPLYTDQFRTPVLVNNLAAILIELCSSSFIGTLHAGGTNRINRLSFGKQMCEILGYNSGLLRPTSMGDVVSLAPRPRDVSLNVTKAMSILQTKLLSTKTGLEKMRG